jgi:UDP-N-acetylglucosamine--N-acetylmuramyl-(pentapeptide) pyrophosphoryl-undecaprenol N-acetylglucosamine transferase
MKVLFAGGGTGGHVCPAVAVARSLAELAPGSSVLFLGTGRPVEERILSRARLPHRALASAPFGWRTVFANARGFARAYWEARRFMPDVVLGLGGYASAPGVLAAKALGARVALFEPNAVAGKATTTLARLADEVYLHWEQPLAAKTVVTGTPLNENAVAPRGLTPQEARASLDLPEDKPCVLVVGGSQGARGLNRWIQDAIHEVATDVSFIHISGAEDLDVVRHAYRTADANARVVPFLDGMATAYRAATIAVCRSGAATLAELAAEGVPAVLVPYPRAVLDHQRANARAYELQGGGKLLDEGALGASVLEQVCAMAEDELLLREMRKAARAQAKPDAARSIARALLALAHYSEPTVSTDKGVRTAGRVPAHAL